MNKEYKNPQFNEDDTINIREELEKYVFHWKWFLLGVIFSLLLAFLYLRYTTSQFSASSSIMIKDNKKSGISAELAVFEDMGIIGGGSANNTDNEIEILKSRKIIGNVVDTLNLDITYYVEGRIKKTEVYRNSPFFIEFLIKDALLNKKDTSFVVSVHQNTLDFKDDEGNLITTYDFDKQLKSKLGVFIIKRNTVNQKEELNEDVIVHIKPRYKVIDGLQGRINITPANKKSSILKLSLKDPVVKKAEDILNQLAYQYNKDAITDKNLVSEKTRDFINERLAKIEIDLAKIDDKAEGYKDKKGFTGVSSEGELILKRLELNTEKVAQATTQLSLAKSVKNDLQKQSKGESYLPANLGFKDIGIASAIDKYNELILRKNKISINAGEQNPNLIQIKNEIFSSRKSLNQSLTNFVKSLQFELNELKKQENRIRSRVKSIPSTERGFIDIARQQEIKAGLYQYLLKKKEETAISLAVSVPNAKIIDVAYGSKKPVSPKKKIIYLAALLLGLLIPFVIIYLKNLLDTKIHSRKDIEELTSVPFIGDVPHSDTDEKIVIGSDVRSSTAEAFRLIRTNLDFMLTNKGNQNLGKTIFITSTTSGEGKSFISINLSATLALSGKRVLLIGMDLRAPKVTEYLGIPDKKGVTNFITNNSLELKDIIFDIPEIKGLDIISSGVVPPNPAELLMTDRVEKLFKEVRNNYDYIIVDTAPVNLVTDTLLLAKHADMFLYVTRANYLDKRMLVIPQSLYDEKKLPNMAIIINDSDMNRGYGGYGYGYGYGYVSENNKKPWYKKIFG